jgi:hypothetical protein
MGPSQWPRFHLRGRVLPDSRRSPRFSCGNLDAAWRTPRLQQGFPRLVARLQPLVSPRELAARHHSGESFRELATPNPSAELSPIPELYPYRRLFRRRLISVVQGPLASDLIVMTGHCGDWRHPWPSRLVPYAPCDSRKGLQARLPPPDSGDRSGEPEIPSAIHGAVAGSPAWQGRKGGL